MKKSNSICSIIVTHNRKKLLEKNIKAIVNQSIKTDILIYDNCSTDGTREYLQEKGLFKLNRINYIYANKNTGGSGGFYRAMKKAYDMKYDFFWLMDDDGRPMNNTVLEEIVKVYNYIGKKEIIINSLVICDESKSLSFELYGENEYEKLKCRIINQIIKNDINPFNGTFVTKEVVKKIGLPKQEFFISGDETEYMMRAKKNNCEMLTAVNSLYFHPIPNNKTKKIFNKNIKIRQMPIWRTYYEVRNYAYIHKKYENKISQLKYCIKVIMKSFISERKASKFKYTVLGLYDGFSENFSKELHLDNDLKELC